MNGHAGVKQGIPFGPGGSYRRPVEFRILGSLEVSEDGGGPIPLGGPKQRAVLAHLLLRANHLVPTEVLIDEVWGEDPPEAVRNSLQSYASHLRKALGSGRLEGSRAGYLLRADSSEVDLVRFQSLVRDARRMMPIDAESAAGTFDHALALWRGPAFADLAEEPSLRAEAARLEELRLAAIEDRIDALLALGEHPGAIGELQTLTAAHPLRERLWGQLMLALYRAGRQAEALAAYQRAREILSDELGIDPSPDLRRLHERVLQQSPDLDMHGEPLRGYRLLERMGEGSLGVLYRATQPNVGREVVVRIIHERLAGDAAFVRRFEPEAQAVAILEHPHIAPVHDYWREPGRAYIVGRLFRGGSLADRLEHEAPLAPDHALRTLGEVASALSAAHRRGIAHGGVRPSNVLFDDEGNAYLTDFHIAVLGTATARDDVRAFATLAREVLGERAPSAALEVIDRAERSDVNPDAAAFIGELSAAFGATPKASGVAEGDVRNPYKGLRPFLEADAPDFYGREALVQRLLERLGRPGDGSRFLGVVGPSGSGKSSLVRAGLLPALRRGALPSSEGWFVTDMHPGRHPMEELEAALLRVAVRPPAGLLGLLEAGPRGLLEAADRIVPDGAELVLVIDQFEEAFTLTQDGGERSQLLDAVRVAVADSASRVRMIVTLRADFYDRPLRHAQVAELLGACTEVVPPLTPDELQRAVVRPAERAGLAVDPALVAQVAADVVEQPGALPLVQYALTELFDRRADGRLTLEAYRDIGGVVGAIAARAEHLFASRDPAEQETVRQLFLRLVTLGEGTSDTRRRIRLSELSAIEVEPGSMDSVLDAYGRHRLLTFDRDPATREPTVEVAHESLLNAWDRLHRWIDAAREDVQTNRRLADAAKEWNGNRRERSFLLTGSRLDQFESWASSTGLSVGRPEREFLHASVSRREQEQATEEARAGREVALKRRSMKRLWALVAVLAAAAVVAGSLTAITIDRNAEAQRASRLATARELAGAAAAALEADRDLGILLALEAMDAVAVDGLALPEAEEVLWQSAQLSSARSLGGFSEVSLTPDLRLVAIVATDGPTGVWELATGRRLFTISGHAGAINACTGLEHGTCDAIFHVALSPDGTRIATGHGDGNVQIRDVETGRLVLALDLVSDAVARSELAGVLAPSVFFSPDGRLLVMGAIGRVSIWDSRTGAVVMSRVGGRGIENAAFPLDGSLVAVWAKSIGGYEGRVIDTTTGYATHPWFENRQAGPAFAPDGESVAFTQVLTVRVLSMDGASEHTVQMSGRITDFVFSPDGEILAVAGDIGKVFLDDADDGIAIAVLDTGAASVGALAFSADGSLLATGDENGLVKIWDLDSRRQIASIPGHPGAIVELGFSPDGSSLAAASSDGTVLLHLVGLEDQIALARDRLVRGFTDEECHRYLHLEDCSAD